MDRWERIKDGTVMLALLAALAACAVGFFYAMAMTLGLWP